MTHAEALAVLGGWLAADSGRRIRVRRVGRRVYVAFELTDRRESRDEAAALGEVALTLRAVLERLGQPRRRPRRVISRRLRPRG